jgi:hypothetical protein
MIDLPPVSPTYPIKKPDKIIRERKQQPDNGHSQKKKKEEGEDRDLNEPPEQHIDEYI